MNTIEDKCAEDVVTGDVLVGPGKADVGTVRSLEQNQSTGEIRITVCEHRHPMYRKADYVFMVEAK